MGNNQRRRFSAGCAALLLLAGTSGCERLTGGGAGNNASSNASTTNGSANKGAFGGMMGRGGSNQQAPRDDAVTANSAGAAPASDSGGKPAGGEAQQQSTSRDNFDRRVRIVNASDQRLSFLYGSATSEANWGADRIPDTTLPPGSSTVVDFNDNNGACQYDLRAVFADNSSAEQRNVNVCAIVEWRAEPGGGTTR